MIYVPDTEGIRDKREKVTEIQEEIQIANLEKQIDLIQDEIDALGDQKDLFKDMIEESNKYYENLIKQLEESTKAAGKAAGGTGSAISGLKKNLDNGKTLSYYIWTDKDDYALTSAKSRLIELNRLVGDDASHALASTREDMAKFVEEFGRLKESRQVTDDLTSSLDALINSDADYLNSFQHIVTGVDERIDNTANYTDRILETVKITTDEIHDLWQTLDSSKSSADTTIEDAGNVAESVSASVSAAEENVNHLSSSIGEAVLKATESTTMLNTAVSNISSDISDSAEQSSNSFRNMATNISEIISDIVSGTETIGNSLNENLSGTDVSEATAGLENAVQASSDASEKIQEVTTSLNDLTNEISSYELPPVSTENFIASFSENGTVLTALTNFVSRFKEICGDIPAYGIRRFQGRLGEPQGTVNH